MSLDANKAPVKVCVVCGMDVSQQKRVKDTCGDYYCHECWKTMMEVRAGISGSGPAEVKHQAKPVTRTHTSVESPPPRPQQADDESEPIVLPPYMPNTPYIAETACVTNDNESAHNRKGRRPEGGRRLVPVIMAACLTVTCAIYFIYQAVVVKPILKSTVDSDKRGIDALTKAQEDKEFEMQHGVSKKESAELARRKELYARDPAKSYAEYCAAFYEELHRELDGERIREDSRQDDGTYMSNEIILRAEYGIDLNKTESLISPYAGTFNFEYTSIRFYGDGKPWANGRRDQHRCVIRTAGRDNKWVIVSTDAATSAVDEAVKRVAAKVPNP